MKDVNLKQVSWAVVALILVLAMSLGGCVAPPAPLQPNPEQPAAAVADRYFESLIVDKELDVNGVSRLDGAVTMGSSLNVTGAITGGTLACTSASWPENVAITGTLSVDGATTLNSTLAMTTTNAAGGSANPIDYTATLGAMNGGDDFTLFDVNITNANHTSTANTVQALDIAGITADTEATETAIRVGAGWDTGLDLDGNSVTIGADGGVTLDETSDDAVSLTFGAGTGLFTVATGNLQVGGGTPGVTLNGQDAYVTGTFEVDGAAQFDGAVTTASTLAANGGLSVDTSNFTVSGTTGAAATASSMGIGTWVKLSAQAAISVTAGLTIEPTGTYQPLTSDGAKTCSTTTCIADGATAGDLLILSNENASDIITIDGTGGNVECKSDVALGAGDTLSLIWNGSDWNCIAGYDNS